MKTPVKKKQNKARPPPNMQQQLRHEPSEGEGTRIDRLFPTTDEFGIPVPYIPATLKELHEEYGYNLKQTGLFYNSTQPKRQFVEEYAENKYLQARIAYIKARKAAKKRAIQQAKLAAEQEDQEESDAELQQRVKEEEINPLKQEDQIQRRLFEGGKRKQTKKSKRSTRRKSRKQ